MYWRPDGNTGEFLWKWTKAVGFSEESYCKAEIILEQTCRQIKELRDAEKWTEVCTYFKTATSCYTGETRLTCHQSLTVMFQVLPSPCSSNQAKYELPCQSSSSSEICEKLLCRGFFNRMSFKLGHTTPHGVSNNMFLCFNESKMYSV